jgi:glycosyltransferase involved in cell wall biosynthesis
VAGELAKLAPHLPVRTIPFLVSANDHPPPPLRPPVGDRELRVAFLGRLVRHKGVDWLVEKWDQIVQEANAGPARLDVYGGDYENEPLLEALSARTNKRVQLHGPYPTAAVTKILANTDLVLLPSIYEGLPLVLVEAMLQGVPFVTMAAGGTADLVNPDVEVTPVDDRPGFVAAVGRLTGQLRAGTIDTVRLHAWADARYGRRVVADAWQRALLNPREFFGL